MKKIMLISASLFASAISFAAVTSKQSVKVDQLEIGRPSPAADPQVTFKGSNQKIKANRSTNKLQFTNDGTTYKNLGSGSGGSGGLNLLSEDNFDFEVGAPFTGWTASGGTVTAETTNPLFDDKSLIWDASANGQTLTSASKTIKAGMIGRKCSADIYYSYVGTTNDLRLEVRLNGSSTIAETELIGTTGSNIGHVGVYFDCPSSLTDALAMRLLSNTTNPALIKIDNAFLGSDKNTYQLSQAELYAGVVYNNTANCDVTTTSGTVAEVANDNDCSSRSSVGKAEFVNNQFKFRLAGGLPKGSYELSTMIPVYSDTSGTTCEVYVTSSGGTNMPVHYATVGFENAVGNNPAGTMIAVPFNQPSDVTSPVEFFMNWRRTTGGGTCHMATTNAGGATFSMSLKKFPTNSAEALTVETSGYFSEVRLSGANLTLVNANVTTRQGVGDAGLTMAIMAGATDTQVPCGGGNVPTGLTCSAGNEQLGFVPYIPYAGDFEICAEFPVEISMNGSGRYYQQWSWVETSLDGSSDLRSFPATTHGQDTTAAGVTGVAGEGVRFCNIINFPTTGRKRLEAKYTQQVVNTSNLIVLLDANSTVSERQAKFSIKPVTQQVPAPIFTEVKRKVNTSDAGLKLEFATTARNTACTASPCTLASKTSGVSSVTRGSAGSYTVNFVSGTFTQPPACVGTSDSQPGITILTINTSSSTTAGFQIYRRTDGGINDDAFTVQCVGF